MKCLNKNSLLNLGLSPLVKPIKLKKPKICTKIFSESKSCVKEEEMEKYL